MPQRLSRLARRALLIVGCGLLGACGDDEPEQGQVMVVVTSDMAVPTDFDTLTWSVTLSGDSRPFATSSIGLERGEDLPATLSVHSGPKTTKPVTIRIEGRKSGANDVLRVAREASLVVPTDRTAELLTPLNWLCSDANLPEGCPEGQTCRAGTCVDARVDSKELDDYRARSAESCLDTAACIRNQIQKLPTRDPETHECVIGDERLGDDADVNIALVVDNESVGNYGFCTLPNECYVMLSRDDREGFRVTKTAGTPIVTLPNAVCDAVGRSVATVALVPRYDGCPASLEGRSLCTPLDELCLEEPKAARRGKLCPKDWPDSWVGHACSGTALPTDQDPELLACFFPPSADTAPAGANGRWCCTKGEPPASDPLLIDDMSGGPQIKITVPEGMITGWWWTSLGDGSGSIEPEPLGLFTYRTFDPPIQPEAGPEIERAACLRSKGFLGYTALMGFNYLQEPHAWGDRPIDLSGYGGIEFWGWADEPFPNAPLSTEVVFPNHDTHYDDPNAGCWTREDQSKRCDPHHANVPLTKEWTRHFVRFDELHQSREVWEPPQIPFPEFDATTVYSTQFVVKGAGPDIMSQPFDFCIAHLSFTPLDPPEAPP